MDDTVVKVKRGLEHCTAWNGMGMCQPKSGYDCPYDDEADCKFSLHLDALSVIKEQQAEIGRLQRKEKPIEVHAENKYQMVANCPVCGSPIYKYFCFGQEVRYVHHCMECGQSIMWIAEEN